MQMKGIQFKLELQTSHKTGLFGNRSRLFVIVIVWGTKETDLG